jgi:hypothetical protein
MTPVTEREIQKVITTTCFIVTKGLQDAGLLLLLFTNFECSSANIKCTPMSRNSLSSEHVDGTIVAP